MIAPRQIDPSGQNDQRLPDRQRADDGGLLRDDSGSVGVANFVSNLKMTTVMAKTMAGLSHGYLWRIACIRWIVDCRSKPPPRRIPRSRHSPLQPRPTRLPQHNLEQR